MLTSLKSMLFIVAMFSVLLTSCGISEEELQRAVATSLAATKEFDEALDRALAETQSSIPTQTLIPIITPVPTKPGLVINWEFENEGEFGGWGTNSFDTLNIISLEVFNGVLKMETLAVDNLIYNRDLRLDVNSIIEIEIRMRVSDGRTLKVYFATEDQPELDEAKRFSIRIQAGENFITYRINTGFRNVWQGIVTELRIDPTDKPAIVEIDHIRLNTSTD